jgi:alcohol dehydrogenase class IV
MGIATAAEGDQAAAAKLLQELRDLNRDLAVPSPAAYGIDAARWEALLPTMAEQALASGSPANNPVVPTAEEIIALYRRAWQG